MERRLGADQRCPYCRIGDRGQLPDLPGLHVEAEDRVPPLQGAARAALEGLPVLRDRGPLGRSGRQRCADGRAAAACGAARAGRPRSPRPASSGQRSRGDDGRGLAVDAAGVAMRCRCRSGQRCGTAARPGGLETHQRSAARAPGRGWRGCDRTSGSRAGRRRDRASTGSLSRRYIATRVTLAAGCAEPSSRTGRRWRGRDRSRRWLSRIAADTYPRQVPCRALSALVPNASTTRTLVVRLHQAVRVDLLSGGPPGDAAVEGVLGLVIGVVLEQHQATGAA